MKTFVTKSKILEFRSIWQYSIFDLPIYIISFNRFFRNDRTLIFTNQQKDVTAPTKINALCQFTTYVFCFPLFLSDLWKFLFPNAKKTLICFFFQRFMDFLSSNRGKRLRFAFFLSDLWTFLFPIAKKDFDLLFLSAIFWNFSSNREKRLSD